MNAVVEVSGTPYEQGLEEGRQLVEVIRRNVVAVQGKLRDSKVDMPRYKAFVDRNAGFMRERHADLLEEMRGIADGSGVSFDDILTINIPAYFMTDYFNQECSMIMVRGKATADGCTYVIKNRDMGMPMEQAVIKRAYPNGLKMVEVNGAGTVTYPASGMNSYGLGVTTTGFWSPKAPSDVEKVDSAHIFLNVHLLLAECKTAKEVLEYVKTSPRMNGLNVIAVDRENAYVIEMTKDREIVQEDDGTGVLYRTNHYVSEELRGLNPDVTEYTSTHKRYARIGELLQERYGKIRFQDLFRTLSDHENGINCICRHPTETSKGQTVSTSMFVLEDGEAWTTLGNPCTNLRLAKLYD